MRFMIRYGNFTAMGIDNGFTEGKSQAETPPAVSDFIRPAVKHVKDMGLYLIGNPRSVVRNTYNDLILSLLRKNFYFRSLRRFRLRICGKTVAPVRIRKYLRRAKVRAEEDGSVEPWWRPWLLLFWG